MHPSELWSTGDYGTVGDLWSSPGRDLAAALGVSGRDIVDLATGTGVTAIAAARQGAATVVGVDVTPSLLAEARRRGEIAGVDVRWVEADVESLPLPDDSADLVVSTFGLVFAADPRQALAEARRVARPGGRVVFTSWSPHGLFGAIRVTMAPWFPDAPTPWHESVEGLREVAGADAHVQERDFELRVASPAEFVTSMERHSAPIVLATRTLGQQWPRAREALLEVVFEAMEQSAAEWVARVPYWVTTLDVAR